MLIKYTAKKEIIANNIDEKDNFAIQQKQSVMAHFQCINHLS